MADEAELRRLAKKNAEAAAYRRQHREELRKKQRLYYQQNREEVLARARTRPKDGRDREKRKAWRKKVYAENREAIKEQRKVFRKNNPELVKAYARRSTLKRRYGLTEGEYHSMLAGQDNACAICESKFDGERIPAVDHCHRTGKVRAILCRSCNSAIALLGEDPKRMSRAIEYVIRHGRDT